MLKFLTNTKRQSGNPMKKSLLLVSLQGMKHWTWKRDWKE